MRHWFPLLTVLLLSVSTQADTNFVTTSGGGDGSSWVQATSLTNALATAGAGDQVWIAAGTYTNINTFVVGSASLTLYGGLTNGMGTLVERDAALYPAVLDGEAARRVAEITATDVTLDGLVISNGLHNADGCGLSAGAAGTGLVLANCMFAHNEASVAFIDGGGASFSGCAVLMTNCIFSGNFSATPSTIWYQGGGGFHASSGSDVTIIDCVFTNNGNQSIESRDGNRGGAFLMYGGSLTVSGTTFIDNGFYGRSGDYNGGGAGRLLGVNPAHFSDCLFASNYVWSTTDRNTSGGGMLIEGGSSRVRIEHCLFDGNFCVENDSQGGALCVVGGEVAVTNCTFVNNWTEDQGGAVHVYGGSLVVSDSIFHTNTATIRGQDISLFPGGSATLSHCRIGGDEETDSVFDGGAGIFIDNLTTVDPRFAGDGDYHLRSKGGRWDPALNGGAGGFTNDTLNSLCIDAGNPDSDFGNEVVPNGSRVNLGRYGNTVEASKTLDVVPVVTNVGFSVTNTLATMLGGLLDNGAGAMIRFYYGTTDAGSVFTGWDGFVDLPGRYEAGEPFDNSLGNLLPNTQYFFRTFATNSAGQDFADNAMTFTTGAQPPGGPSGILHVKPDAPGTQDGSTWFDAYHSLVDAMTAVNAGTNEIWASAGTVQDGATLSIAADVRIYGGFVGTETNRALRDHVANVSILDGEGVRDVVSITAGTVGLDGLVISNGMTDSSSGGGLHASGYDTVTVVNCHVVDHQKKPGVTGSSGYGAYFSGGSVMISNTTFAHNNGHVNGGSVGAAAGIHALNVDMVIIDSMFISNSLAHFDTRDGFGGGAILASGGSLAISNTAFTGNHGGPGSTSFPSTKGGGALHLTGNLKVSLVNCAFANNETAWPGDAARKPSGGAIFVTVGVNTVVVENCSFGWNHAQHHGGAIHNRSGTVIIKNSILFGNTAGLGGDQMYITNAAFVSNDYVMISGTGVPQVVVGTSSSIVWSTGIRIGEDPLFAGTNDLHLQSRAGRYDPLLMNFVGDSKTSPAIDAGDPDSPFSKEPDPRGKRINLGAYGNTVQASKSPVGGTVLLFQ